MSQKKRFRIKMDCAFDAYDIDHALFVVAKHFLDVELQEDYESIFEPGSTIDIRPEPKESE